MNGCKMLTIVFARVAKNPGAVSGRGWWGTGGRTCVARSSGPEGVVGFAVVGEVADAVHGVFEEGRDGEDREANGRAGEGADEEEREAGGFAEEAEDAEGFGGFPSVNGCPGSPYPKRAEAGKVTGWRFYERK